MSHIHSLLLAQSYNVKEVSFAPEGFILPWSLDKIVPMLPDGSLEDSISITSKNLGQKGALGNSHTAHYLWLSALATGMCYTRCINVLHVFVFSTLDLAWQSSVSPPLLPFTLGNHCVVYIYVRLIQTTSELQVFKWHPLCKGVSGHTRDKETKFLAQNSDFWAAFTLIFIVRILYQKLCSWSKHQWVLSNSLFILAHKNELCVNLPGKNAPIYKVYRSGDVENINSSNILVVHLAYISQ